jgi:S1-C subfamily serine protease
VHLSDGRVYTGRVVALDAASDVAVVKVDPEGPLPVVQLGDSHRYSGGVQDTCVLDCVFACGCST